MSLRKRSNHSSVNEDEVELREQGYTNHLQTLEEDIEETLKK